MTKRMATRHLPALNLSRIATAVQLALITGLTVGALGVAAPPAYAQAAQARQAFSVPAGSLGMALNTFAAEAGVELTAEASLLQGKHSAGLSGSYSVPEGFYELLRGHGLQAVRDDCPLLESVLGVGSLDATAGLGNRAGPRGHVPRPDWRPQTHFETRGQKLGHGVWDLVYDKERETGMGKGES